MSKQVQLACIVLLDFLIDSKNSYLVLLESETEDQLDMASPVREEIWIWRGISRGKKSLSLTHLAIFWVVWKERNMRAFEEVVDDFDRVSDRWFQTLFFYYGSSFLYNGGFGDLVDFLIDNKYFLYWDSTPLVLG